MANFALIKNGIVDNIIIAEQSFIDNHCQEYDACVEYADGTYVGVGFSWDGENFIAPIPEE